MTDFTIKMLESALDDMEANRLPLERLRIADTDVPGLRAVLTKQGRRIAFHTQYEIDGEPLQMHIGDLPDISIEEARKIAIYVRDQAKGGINIQEEFRKKFLSELRRDAA